MKQIGFCFGDFELFAEELAAPGAANEDAGDAPEREERPEEKGDEQ